jgi:hypothetical protein
MQRKEASKDDARREMVDLALTARQNTTEKVVLIIMINIAHGGGEGVGKTGWASRRRDIRPFERVQNWTVALS